mmetsp:Transcript_11503/g.10173  ORF Transcript_11503/g.10173 Transcript_11503/m.10173 type:complete len:166 (+) Transcript_11503:298-795(+)
MIMIGEDKDLSELREMQAYGISKLIKGVKSGANPKKIREEIKEMASQVGTAGDARQRLLKSAIRIIMENIVPDRMRVLFKMLEKGPGCSPEEYRKLFEVKSEQAQSLLKNENYNEYDSLHYTCGVKPAVIETVGILNKKSCALFEKFKIAVKSLVRTRNRILQLQ